MIPIDAIDESPQWASLLKSGHVLSVTMKRREDTFYVNDKYHLVDEEVADVFESFIGLRIKYQKNNYVNAKGNVLSEDDPQFNLITREDVRRVAMFLCDPKVVDIQTDKFIDKYFPKDKELLSQEEFTKALELACEKRRLNKLECFFLVFEDPSSSALSYIMAVVIMILILVSSICFVLSTDPEFQVQAKDRLLPPEPHPSFVVIEVICIYCFLIEYLSRVFVVWAVREDIVGSGSVKFPLIECFPRSESELSHQKHGDEFVWVKRFQRTYNYVVNPMNMIDLVAILPFFISKLVAGESGSLSSLRILRLARVMRIFKLAKKNEGINMLSTTMSMSRGSLNLLVFFGIIGTVLFGSLIYFTESGVWHNPEECAKALPDFDGCADGHYLRPDKFGIDKELTPFSSIPRTFWWVVVTATTVGYGDMYPTTGLGKLVASFAMVCGLLVLALPISIIGTNFLVCYEKLDERTRKARSLEELSEKIKKEEKEARAAEKAQQLKDKALAFKVNWPKGQAAPQIVDEVGNSSSRSKLGAAIAATSGASDGRLKSHTMRSLHRLMTRKKSMTDGHQSLVSLKSKARLIPSFLFDARVALNPPANLTFVNVDRRSKLLQLSLTRYGGGDKDKTSGMSDVALVVKSKPLLDKAQEVLECIQTLHTRGKIDEPTVLNVAREVLDITRKILILKQRRLYPLKMIGAEVDAAIQLILAWLGRDADCFYNGDEFEEEEEEESFTLEAEDERRVRILLFSFTVAALEVAKPTPVDLLRKATQPTLTPPQASNKSPVARAGSPVKKKPPPPLNLTNIDDGSANPVNWTKSGASAPHTIRPDPLSSSSSLSSLINSTNKEFSGDRDTYFGEGSFQVKMGEKGMDFTLIPGYQTEKQAVNSSTGSNKYVDSKSSHESEGKWWWWWSKWPWES